MLIFQIAVSRLCFLFQIVYLFNPMFAFRSSIAVNSFAVITNGLGVLNSECVHFEDPAVFS